MGDALAIFQAPTANNRRFLMSKNGAIVAVRSGIATAAAGLP
jgi:hypothetical protein